MAGISQHPVSIMQCPDDDSTTRPNSLSIYQRADSLGGAETFQSAAREGHGAERTRGGPPFPPTLRGNEAPFPDRPRLPGRFLQFAPARFRSTPVLAGQGGGHHGGLRGAKIPVLRSEYFEKAWGAPQIQRLPDGGWRLRYRKGDTLNFVSVCSMTRGERAPVVPPRWEEPTGGLRHPPLPPTPSRGVLRSS